ncbi:MAG: Rne/Rng family ribonuclease [Deltaproteobacteria bacterium]|nr:Rne/Rng family ribonuclease [Deltaproteobacteria bacterium]
MIINVVHTEESRVAIVEKGRLTDLAIETTNKEKTRGNIYRGIVQKVQPSLHAAFINYGANRNGFLRLDEVHPLYYNQKQANPKEKPAAGQILKKNQEVLVQVTKEGKGNKGSALTTYVSLPGRYMVLMPGYKRSGVSKKIEDEAERKKLKDIGRQLKLPEDMGFIIRTAGINKTKKDLQKDANYLLRLWKVIDTRSKKMPLPSLVYQESSMVIQAIRDYYTTDISEVIVDNPEVFKKVKEFFKQIIPKYQKNVKLYEGRTPIFLRYKIETQIESLYNRIVQLKSGGSISIDPTEALVSIDVNSARFTQVKDPEESSLITNIEAAVEIARQMRLRDLGGLIVIDFIDMKLQKNRFAVEKQLKAAFKIDKANIEMAKISKFGLMEMSREHLRPPLFDESHIECIHCGGSGIVRSKESIVLTILRELYDKASNNDMESIQVILPLETAEYLLNRKRREIHTIEELFKTEIVIQSAPVTPMDNFRLECVPKA